MRKRKKARKKRFWTAWRFILAMSFCLNLFGMYSFAKKELSKQPAIQRWTVLVMIDGIRYRIEKYWNFKI